MKVSPEKRTVQTALFLCFSAYVAIKRQNGYICIIDQEQLKADTEWIISRS